MREEVLRILKLVEQGRLRPDEAMSLIEALGYADMPGAETEEQATTRAEEAQAPGGEKKEERAGPKVGVEEGAEGEGSVFERIGRTVEEALKDAEQKLKEIDWRKISETIRSSTQRGLEEVRKALDEMERGGWRVGWPWGHEVRAEHQLPFTIAAGQTMQIEIPLGDVQVEGGFDGGRVEAEVTLRGINEQQAQERAKGWTLMVEQAENGVVIRAPELEPPTAANVELRVQIPTGVHVQIKTIRGDVSVQNTKARVSITNAQGDVHVSNAREQLQIQTAGGDLHVEDFEGERLEIETKGGDIHLEEVRAEHLLVRSAAGDISLEAICTQDLTVETVKGDIHAELVEPLRGNANLNTVSGDIHLELPDGSDCRVTLDTIVGDVECELPAQNVEKQQNRWTGTCGAGTGQLKASTVHGDVHVEMCSVEAESGEA